ncbi:hypothetical protein DFH06DRAFT_759446 [Mycena polygramma]|nr:hypothetical protein DFH06DRAFT_759446 [Mycena polygramma]
MSDSDTALLFRANSATSKGGWRPMIATSAPEDLREVLERAHGRPSALARKTITCQLQIHDEYVSAPRKDATHPPSLVDLAEDQIAEGADVLEQILDPVLIWGWHKISYALLRGALERLSSEPTKPPKRQKVATSSKAAGETTGDIDEWIIEHEKFLGDGERLGDDWRTGLITLRDADAVFPGSTKTTKARKIRRPEDLPGYKMLDGKRQVTIDIQPSVAAFKRSFDRMSDGLLKNLNWDNVVVAGGIVLGSLLAVETAAGKSQSEHWKSSDIDVYIYGLAPKEANEKIKHLFATFRANLPPGSPTLVVRNSKTITFYSRYPLRRIQVVLKLVKSPKAVLLNFDLDICAMGWDGTELWMLPRAARALETGFNVFTMNLIQGHYLSERRATQEQRVFKYANKGYGIRILPTYISSLKESQANIDEICRDETLFALDIGKIAEASRVWTETVVDLCLADGDCEISHYDLENKHQISSEPQGRSCLSSFSLFARHVELWDMAHRGEIVIDEDEWALGTYGDFPESILSYDDTPSHTWGEDFNIPDFEHEISSFNLRQITQWLDNDGSLFMQTHGLDDDGDEFKAAARITYGPTVAKVLETAKDVVLPVVLPVNFAAFANDLIGDAQNDAGLKVQKILTPAVKSHKHLIVEPTSHDSSDGLFLWRIGKEMMWQQVDRRIDEVFEALYAFYRVHDQINGEHWKERLITELSRRAIQPTVEDEFEAFARWVGRQPIFVRRFYNHVGSFDHMKGQREQYKVAESDEESD